MNMLKRSLIRPIAVAVMTIAVILVSMMIGKYAEMIAITIMIFYIYSLAWSLVANTGMISLGHALFFALGSYAYGIFSLIYGINMISALFIGPIIGALAGLAVGFIAGRLRDWYIGMFTFALTPAGYALAVSDQLKPWTGGAVGFAPPAFSLSMSIWLPFSALLAFATYMIVFTIQNSRMGFALSAINDDEVAAATIGINTRLYKIIIFGISGYLSALAGAMFVSMYSRYISPEFFGYPDVSYNLWPIFYSIIGGMGTPEGVLLGTIILDPLTELARTVIGGPLALVTFGVLLAVVIIKTPGGIYGYVIKYFEAKSQMR